MDKSREQFEAWFNDMIEPNFKKYQIDTPEQKLVRDVSWLAWKKSRAVVEIEHPEQDSYLGTRQVTFERDAMWLDAINEQGLKVRK